MKDSHSRSVLKGVTWRIVGTMDTMFLSFLVTGNAGYAIRIGVTEVLTKIILYYLHERLWNVISFGRIGTKGPTHVRSLLKGVSWRAVGTVDTIVIAFFVTGEPLSALSIGGIEVFTKIGFFYLHERIWSKIRWGRKASEISSNSSTILNSTS